MMDEMEDHCESDYEPVIRPEGYYDLIELPNGRHVPAPIAERLIGEAIIEKIPKGHRVRDSQFFYCVQCDEQQTRINEWLKARRCHDLITSSGHSFYRCKIHKPTTQEENEIKESMLVRLVLNGMYKSLRYVEASDDY